MITVYTNFFDERRTVKPTPKEVKYYIRTACSKPRHIAMKELLNMVGHGATFEPCAINGKGQVDEETRRDNFISGQLLVLDFDNKDKGKEQPFPVDKRISMDEAIAKAKEKNLPVYAAYHTFSHSETLEKFRLIFVLDSPIMNATQWKYALFKVMGIYEARLIDAGCKSPANLFYGTNKGIAYIDENAILSTSDLLFGYTEDWEEPVKKASKPRNKRQTNDANSGSSANDMIRAIQQQDDDYIKSVLNRAETVFDNRDEFVNYVFHDIDIHDLLGVTGNNFRCVLPTHDGADLNNPSGSIFRTPEGVWKYRCFDEEMTWNIYQLIQEVGNFKSTHETWDFIKSIFNLRVKETEWAKAQAQELKAIEDYLDATNDEMDFSKECPIASNNLRSSITLLGALCRIAEKTIFPEMTGEGNIIFYASERQLAKAIRIRDRKTVEKRLKALQLHRIIIALPDKDVPGYMLKKARNGANNDYNHVQFYMIPSWVYQHLRTIESWGEMWKDKHMTLMGMSYETIYRNYGEDVARQIYPQYAGHEDADGNYQQRKPSQYAEDMHERIASMILDSVSNNGYVLESDIVNRLVKVVHSQKLAKRLVKRNLQDVLDCYDLEYISANGELKTRYGIESKGYPKIIISRA